MPVIKSKYPILEYDPDIAAIVNPQQHFSSPSPASVTEDTRKQIPRLCLVTFMRDALNSYVKKNEVPQIDSYDSEVQSFPIYKTAFSSSLKNNEVVELALMQAPVGSAAVAIATDYLIGLGAQVIIACGGCGVLDNIDQSVVIVPISALRDEGASYHYLPPSRSIDLDKPVIEALHTTLDQLEIAYRDCKVWTTDGLFRETPDMVAHRRAEGCQAVDMECSAMAAVARFRGAKFGELLYSGDILANADDYQTRGWMTDLTTREKLFLLALEALSTL